MFSAKGLACVHDHPPFYLVRRPTLRGANSTPWVRIVAEPAMAGDANGDGSVDVIDLGILATNYGAEIGADWDDGDFTGDGKIDVSDLGILATYYGIGSAASATAPEPTTIALLLCGMAILACRIRQHD